MNDLETEYFRTIHPQHRDGVRINMHLYNNISDSILSLLEQEDQISLTRFFDNVCSQFVDLLGESVGWYIYTVKVDLEARGLIRHNRRKKGGTAHSSVTLTPRGKRHRKNLCKHISIL